MMIPFTSKEIKITINKKVRINNRNRVVISLRTPLKIVLNRQKEKDNNNN